MKYHIGKNKVAERAKRRKETEELWQRISARFPQIKFIEIVVDMMLVVDMPEELEETVRDDFDCHVRKESDAPHRGMA